MPYFVNVLSGGFNNHCQVLWWYHSLNVDIVFIRNKHSQQKMCKDEKLINDAGETASICTNKGYCLRHDPTKRWCLLLLKSTRHDHEVWQQNEVTVVLKFSPPPEFHRGLLKLMDILSLLLTQFVPWWINIIDEALKSSPRGLPFLECAIQSAK